MKSKKATKRALLSSALSLVLCFSMLLGTTFAWFTDEAKTGVNTIQSGKLDVALLAADGETSLEGENFQFKNQSGSPEILWEPGATFRTDGFQIVNKGNLALKYKVAINGVSDGSTAKLLEAIDFYVTTIAPDGYTTGANYLTAVINGATGATDAATVSLYDFVSDYKNLLPNETSGVHYLVGHMQDEAGNEYQDLKIEGVGLTVYATQLEAEFDSFGNQYDDDAPLYDGENTPIAYIAPLSGDELNIEVDGLSETITLDAGYQFLPTETADEIGDSQYRYWNADFVVSVDQDVPGNAIALAGYYALYCETMTDGKWVALSSSDVITAGTEIRLLRDGLNVPVRYDEICQFGNDGIGFKCGVYAPDPSVVAGTTINIELRLFETERAATGGSSGLDDETGKSVVIGKYEYTFPRSVATVDELKAALTSGGTATLAEDITVTGTLTVAAGTDATIDLNGHNMSYAVGNSGAAAIISNKGTLELTGEGTISFVAENPDLGAIPAYATNTITNTGTLTIGEGVVITNGSEGGASYAVDNHGTFIMNGGKLVGDRCALRVAKYNQDNVKFVMNGGTITAKTPAWIQLPGSDSAVAPKITVEINGGTMQSTKASSADNNVMYTYSFGNSHANTAITINGGEFLGGTVSIGSGYTGDVPALTINGGTFEYDVLRWNADSTYTVLYAANK